MERSLITYSAPQSVDCLGQIHKWTDTDVVFSYKEICKQLENVSKQLKQQEEESALRAEEKRLIRLKNALWRRMGLSIGYIGKENKFVSPKALKCPSPYQRRDVYPDQQKKYPTVPRYNRFLQNRRIQRKIRHESAITPYMLNYFSRLPRQNTNDPFANHIFNGINFC